MIVRYIHVLYCYFYFLPSGFPYFARGVIRSYFPSPVQILQNLDGQAHNCVHPLIDLYLPGHSWFYCFAFFFFLSWNGFIMGFHGVNFFCGALKLDIFAALVAIIAGLFVFVDMLCRSLLSVLL